MRVTIKYNGKILEQTQEFKELIAKFDITPDIFYLLPIIGFPELHTEVQTLASMLMTCSETAAVRTDDFYILGDVEKLKLIAPSKNRLEMVVDSE